MLAMAHDFRFIADRNLQVKMNEIQLGIIIPRGMMAPLDSKLNKRVLRDICLLGNSLGIKELWRQNVVDKIVKEGELMRECEKFGHRVKSLAAKRDVIRQIKWNMFGEYIKRAYDGSSREDFRVIPSLFKI